MTNTSKLGAGGGAKAPWMPWYGRDFYNDVHVRAMTWAERGIYQFLLWTAWDEGAIPADVKMLARICNEPARAFAKAWTTLEERWVPHPTRIGWLINRRQEQVREQSGELSAKMRALAERKHAKDAANRMSAGQHIPSDLDSGAHAESQHGAHAPPHAESQCDPPCGEAVLTTSKRQMPEPQMDGLDGWSGTASVAEFGTDQASTQPGARDVSRIVGDVAAARGTR